MDRWRQSDFLMLSTLGTNFSRHFEIFFCFVFFFFQKKDIDTSCRLSPDQKLLVMIGSFRRVGAENWKIVTFH